MMIGIGDGKDRVRMRNTYKILVGKPKHRSFFQLGDNIKICFRELDCGVNMFFPPDPAQGYVNTKIEHDFQDKPGRYHLLRGLICIITDNRN
jgi:hypothetical protein